MCREERRGNEKLSREAAGLCRQSLWGPLTGDSGALECRQREGRGPEEPAVGPTLPWKAACGCQWHGPRRESSD